MLCLCLHQLASARLLLVKLVDHYELVTSVNPHLWHSEIVFLARILHIIEQVLCLCSGSLFVTSLFLLIILYSCVCGVRLRWWLACRHALACSFRALNPDFHHQTSRLSADRGRIGNFSPRLLDLLKGNVTEMSFTDTHHPKKTSHFNLFELGRILTGNKSQSGE